MIKYWIYIYGFYTLTFLCLLILQLLAVSSLRAPLTISPLESPVNRRIKMQRILSLSEQLHNGFVHQLIQTGQTNIQVQTSGFGAIHKQRNTIAGKVQSQRSNGGRFVDAKHLEVLGMGDRVGSDIKGDLGLFAVQEKGELVLERWEIDHEESFNGDLEFATRSVTIKFNVLKHIYISIINHKLKNT